MEKTRIPRDEVIAWYECAMENKLCEINLWFRPNQIAHKDLVTEGVLQEVRVGDILMGYSYKGHLFETTPGPGDCEEILHDRGLINACKSGKSA